ncbi:LuxR C-terminal-related transcriptional regulator [Edwardsiella piscicida]|uniref:LuxR C-terminal-related transcriptional regulator n=1 Tax=Edwardsiella piscicida TaxID=1263550 RepID=UPI0009DACCFB|nr:LuxR C-terminal-related transcriptional regulator [Edwardsiella piscicida]EKS7780685.1 hypothetical protein [Edwardsiella piscicida]EKS7784148.1 hypothetical protein [Edwardsiella piscicida]UCQ24028.1 LuxR C-terminal-related transcriptional regulator [Edwardsiella piscicida]UCQ34161.1 LuxR C-terminal-related transcriptional regulator [Edwardsiella piscicida]UCQ44071.1 LuxR C-terminal-related transcriptional regulator [Edwardsiella piscicida]
MSNSITNLLSFYGLDKFFISGLKHAYSAMLDESACLGVNQVGKKVSVYVMSGMNLAEIGHYILHANPDGVVLFIMDGKYIHTLSDMFNRHQVRFVEPSKSIREICSILSELLLDTSCLWSYEAIELRRSRIVSPAEARFMYYFLRGANNNDIAKKISVNNKTSSYIKRGLMRKINAKSNIELLIKYQLLCRFNPSIHQ